MGLGLSSSWKLEKLTFKETPEGRELHIEIDFERGATFLDHIQILRVLHGAMRWPDSL
jgi:hypothetical protein